MTAGGRGGAVFGKGGAIPNPSVSISGSNFTSNRAVTGAGGAAYLEAFGGGVTMRRTRFENEIAGTSGGAVEMTGIKGALLDHVEIEGSVAVGLAPIVRGGERSDGHARLSLLDFLVLLRFALVPSALEGCGLVMRERERERETRDEG